MHSYKPMATKMWHSLSNLLGAQRVGEYKGHRNAPSTSRTRRLALETLDKRNLLAADQLFVGDGGSNTIRQFDAQSGVFIRNAVPAEAAIHGPRGLLVVGDRLLVVNQNVMTEFNGEVLAFHRTTAATQVSPVPSHHPQAPFAPRGMVLKDNILFVADLEGTTHPRIVKYNFTTGGYAGELVPAGFDGRFQPRGLVFGPDGGLYVSGFRSDTFDSADPAGYIFRFDVSNGSYRVVSRNDGDGPVEADEPNALHNPEGLVFGPDGRIYVTSNTSYGNSSILVVDPASGRVVESHQLDTDDPSERVTAETLAFGPGGQLFVPVLVSSAYFQRSAGGVWKYDPASQQFDRSFIPHDYFASVMTEPWYISFGQTDPATLAYVSAQPTSQPPVLSNLEASSLSQTTGSRKFVSRAIRITDADSLTLTGAEIKVTSNYQRGADRLVFRNRGKILGNWNAETGTLTLTGTDTVANYQAALQAVLFQSSNAFVGPRTISFSVRDDAQLSNHAARQVGLVVPEKNCGQGKPLPPIQFPSGRPHRIQAVLGNQVIEIHR